MQINIMLEDENKQGIINLKNFIDKASIDGIEQIEIARSDHADDQMGAGAILSTITAVFTSAENPINELIKCLQKYVDNFRTKIKIPDGKGGVIEINHGRSMKPEELKALITAIQLSN
ncbi:MAG: hypothetical protein H7Y00_17035 [Fimbriimonadaceae bacterium]|nr:hypothetical protein [Chitinophagales bacterium]